MSYCVDNPIPKKDTYKRGKDYLKVKVQGVRRYYPDWEYIEIGRDRDHIRLYVAIAPKYPVSRVAETTKTSTSKVLQEKLSFTDYALIF